MATNIQPDYYLNRTGTLLHRGYPVELLTFDFSNPKTSMIRWHWHDEIELVYFCEGQVYVTCDEDTILASKGDIVFINHNIKHFLTPTGPEDGLFRSLIINPSFIFGLGQLEMEKKYLNPVIHSNTLKHIHIRPGDANYNTFSKYVNELIQLNSEKKSGYELLTKSGILQIWKLLYDIVSSNTVSSNFTSKTANQDEQRIKQAIIYIQEHYMEQITLDDIANSILVSKSECCRCFKRAMNVTPFEYLMKYRILESAKRIQKKSHESISEIAGAVGFNNTSYYNKIFKKFMDCTPTQYRQSFKH